MRSRSRIQRLCHATAPTMPASDMTDTAANALPICTLPVAAVDVHVVLNAVTSRAHGGWQAAHTPFPSQAMQWVLSVLFVQQVPTSDELEFSSLKACGQLTHAPLRSQLVHSRDVPGAQHWPAQMLDWHCPSSSQASPATARQRSPTST